MERKQIPILVRALILATLLVSGIAQAQDGEPQSPAAPAEALTTAVLAPLGTGFTYQGRLDEGGSPVNDICIMNFKLYDAASVGAQVGSTFNTAVSIVDGLFTVTLDFGAGAFDGERRWLEIEVDCEGSGSYADLGRQELTAAPYALYAASAPWSGLAGVPASFADGVDDDTTYSAGFGLTLVGGAFGVVTSTVQQRVTGACGAGYAIRQVNADGSVTCEQDNDADTTYTAGDGLVLDGTEFSAQGSPYANVVVVAQSGGDYTSVQAAIDSITDATADNAYLVWVGPGVYVEQVTMKPYVHLQGAGQGATVITSTATSGSWPPSQATLVLARDTSLRDLTVGNSGTGSRNTALLATAGTTRTLVVDVTAQAQGDGTYSFASFLTGSGTGVTLQHVTALAENGSSYNYGLYNHNGAEAVLHGSSFTGRGGTGARGIYNTGSGTMLEAEGVIAWSEDGSSSNYGLYNCYGKATLHGGSFTGRRGDDAYGIYNTGSGTTLEATGVTAWSEDGSSSNYGLYNTDGAEAMLRSGSFTGLEGDDAYGIYSGGSGTTLEATSITALGENDSASSYGLVNDAGAEATLRGGSFIARGDTTAHGIDNVGSNTTLDATGVTVLAESLFSGFGLVNSSGAQAVLHDSSFTARAGANAHGITNSGSGTTLEARGVTILAENGYNNNFGLYNSSSVAEVDSSRLTGSTAGLSQSGGTVRLGVTQLDGGATLDSGTLTCFQVYDGSYAPYTCPP